LTRESTNAYCFLEKAKERASTSSFEAEVFTERPTVGLSSRTLEWLLSFGQEFGALRGEVEVGMCDGIFDQPIQRPLEAVMSGLPVPGLRFVGGIE
jgi:hypothetical protein